jgi:transposase
VLFAEATRLHRFPPLRAAWARVGTPAIVPVTGRHGRGVLFGAWNVCTGHRIVVRQSSETGSGARVLLTEIRRRYRRAPSIWLLLDPGPAHTAVPTRHLAAHWRVALVWLPQQGPELNGMDQLWRELKRLVAANRQANSVEELAQQAEGWWRTLSPREALRKAGILSERFWLKRLLQRFWPNT